jgi:hypothetical protein
MLKERGVSGMPTRWEEVFNETRKQWRAMWGERIDDKVRAEGIARGEYPLLGLDRGTVVVATRKCRMPDFYEVLERRRKLLGIDADAGYANPSVGGWKKFANTTLKVQPRFRSGRTRGLPQPDESARMQQQKKKGGRGWIHRF